MVVVYRKASGLVGIDFFFFFLCLLGWGIAREWHICVVWRLIFAENGRSRGVGILASSGISIVGS